mgnify:CR=1 FL=1
MTGSDNPAPRGPRPRPRPSWAEREQRRRRQRWYQLLDGSFSIRLLLATGAATLLLVSVNRWENCRKLGFANGCLLADAGGVINIGNVESLSIVSAAFLYLLERNRHRQREHLEAMEVILSCQQAGARLSLARNDAIEQLSARGLWLDGLDLSNTVLQELRAPHARWRAVNLQGSDLQRACLHDADLQNCNLSGADLRNCDLRHADLRRTNLRGANLRGADLTGADLEGACSDGADLQGARLANTAWADRGPGSAING